MGASGYGGGELWRLLSGHPKVEAISGASRRFAGKPVHSVHPNLRGLVDAPFVERIDWNWLAEAKHPVLFGAMPHGELAKRYRELIEQWKSAGIEDRLVVIDLSSDFRIGDPALYQTHYREPHPCPEFLSEWTYGFAERNAFALKGAARIANPGCFAMALQLGLWPLERLSVEGFVAASGATGSSGSGMTPSETTHHPTRSNDFRAYKVLEHQHLAEVRQLLGEIGKSEVDVAFVPHSAPMVRGILTTLQFRLAAEADAAASYRETYAGARFVRLVDGSPRVASVAGSNFADIGVVQKGRQVAVMVALDNLLKGMAGMAVQNMNLALGLDEAAGLWFAGGYPY